MKAAAAIQRSAHSGLLAEVVVAVIDVVLDRVYADQAIPPAPTTP